MYGLNMPLPFVVMRCFSSTTAFMWISINCSSSPRQPENGMIVNLDNISATEGSVITFQCDPGFSLVGEGTATCNNSALWHPDPALVECLRGNIPTSPPPSGNAAIAGGVAGGGVLVVILIILGTLLLCPVIRTKRKKGLASISKTPAGPYYEEVHLAVHVSRGQNVHSNGV